MILGDESLEVRRQPDRVRFVRLVERLLRGCLLRVRLVQPTSTGEQILVCDHVQRRFQYRITTPIFTHHRGTIDVIDLEDGTCLVVYSTEADPRTMALVIGGGTAGALDELKRQMEQPGRSTPGHETTEGAA